MTPTPRPVGSTSIEIGYWEHLPPGYGRDAGPWPLLIFWHGIGENGDGSREQLERVLLHGPPRLVREAQWPQDRPFVLLAPQHRGPLCPSAEDVERFLAFAIETYAVDRARLCLTGLSCGAIGVWSYLAEHAHETEVAAAVLICGTGIQAWQMQGERLRRVALWAFHGAQDPVVAAQGSIEPIARLLAAPPAPDAKEARCTIYEGAGHDSWTRTYDGSAGHDVFAWLLAQRAAR